MYVHKMHQFTPSIQKFEQQIDVGNPAQLLYNSKVSFVCFIHCMLSIWNEISYMKFTSLIVQTVALIDKIIHQ